MAKIIKDGVIVEDNWQIVRLAENETAEKTVLPDGDLIVPFAVWQARRDELLTRPQRGVWLASNETAESVATALKHFAVVAIDFPTFNDGRGFSTATLLRTRYGWRGELRAIGDVQRDHIFFLARVGFDAFAVRADKDINAALAAFKDFSETYQAAVDNPLPLYRRRSA